MLASIIALLPTILPFLLTAISGIIGYFQARAAAQSSADDAQSTALQQHQQDGAQSVVDKISEDAQDQALDQIRQQLDNPPPVIVEKGK